MVVEILVSYHSLFMYQPACLNSRFNSLDIDKPYVYRPTEETSSSMRWQSASHYLSLFQLDIM